jgi:ketosteroid isomerase-like protein
VNPSHHGAPPDAATASSSEQTVLACFTAYEEALSAGDVAAMDSWFADDPRTIRFGLGDEEWGAEAVRHWRRLAPRVPAGRRLSETRVDLWADDLAVVTTLFRYPSSVMLGRQSQTWLRTDAGWRVIHAHVSERPD